VSFKIIMTMSVTRPCSTSQHLTGLQDQDRSVQDQDQERFIWSQASLVLRPSVSDHITIQVDLPVFLIYSNVDNYRKLTDNSVIFTV